MEILSALRLIEGAHPLLVALGVVLAGLVEAEFVLLLLAAVCEQTGATSLPLFLLGTAGNLVGSFVMPLLLKGRHHVCPDYGHHVLRWTARTMRMRPPHSFLASAVVGALLATGTFIAAGNLMGHVLTWVHLPLVANGHLLLELLLVCEVSWRVLRLMRVQ